MSHEIYLPFEFFEDPIFANEKWGKITAWLWLTNVYDPSEYHLRSIPKIFKWSPKELHTFLRKAVMRDSLRTDTLVELEKACRKFGSRTAISAEVKAKVAKRDGNACKYCGDKEGPFHFDHVSPWSRGGSNDASNLSLACVECNLSKGSKTLREWVR